MPNPSTTGGTGAGTEVIRRAFYLSAGTSRMLLEGESGHLYTILSVTIGNHSGSVTQVFDLYIDEEGSGEKAWLAKQISLPPNNVFVWNDKVVMDGTTGDDLKVDTSGSVELKCWCSYIDQEF